LFSFTLTAPTPLYPLSLHDALPISPDSHPISPRVHTHDLPQQACRPLAGTLGGPSSPRKESRCTGQESWVALAHFYRPFYPDLLAPVVGCRSETLRPGSPHPCSPH